MAKPNWNRKLGEVLQQDTRKVNLMGNKGKEYQTEVVPVFFDRIIQYATGRKVRTGTVFPSFGGKKCQIRQSNID